MVKLILAHTPRVRKLNGRVVCSSKLLYSLKFVTLFLKKAKEKSSYISLLDILESDEKTASSQEELAHIKKIQTLVEAWLNFRFPVVEKGVC